MTNLRFEWINWNLICNTGSDLVTQDYPSKSNGTNAETKESGCVLQPSPRAASQASHTLRACTRAIAIGARWGRAREGGVDRGDGIATDGGTETVSIRLKDPELQQAVADAEEEYGNRSEAIRAALRSTFTGEGDAPTTTADGGPTTKAIEAHEWMVDYCGIGGRIGVDTARSLIAQKFQIKAKTIDNLIFRPLEKNDWIAVSQGLHEVAIVVKPRPGADAADDTREVPADD